MRRHLLPLAVCMIVAWFAPAQAAAGALDPSFSHDGIATAFPAGAIATDVGIDGDGRITVVGFSVDGHTDVVAARFRPNGQLDRSFGGNGRVRYDLGAADRAFDVAVTKVGGVVIAGRRTGHEERMFVLRLRPDGSRLPSFGRRGLTIVDFGKPEQGATSVALTPQGRIVIGGYTTNGTLSRSALARLSPTGRRDRGFGHRGLASYDLGTGNEQLNDLVVLDGGSIVAAGYAENAQDPRFSVLRVTGDGRLDRGFGSGGDGASTFDVSGAPDVANALTRTADGDFLLAGYGGAEADWAVLAVRPNGTADPSYGAGGRVVLDLAHAFEETTDVVRWHQRAILVGRIRGTGDDLGIARLKAGGGLDPTFGGDGIVRIDVSGATDATAAAARAGGRLLIAGQTWRRGEPRLLAARLRMT